MPGPAPHLDLESTPNPNGSLSVTLQLQLPFTARQGRDQLITERLDAAFAPVVAAFRETAVAQDAVRLAQRLADLRQRQQQAVAAATQAQAKYDQALVAGDLDLQDRQSVRDQARQLVESLVRLHEDLHAQAEAGHQRAW